MPRAAVWVLGSESLSALMGCLQGAMDSGERLSRKWIWESLEGKRPRTAGGGVVGDGRPQLWSWEWRVCADFTPESLVLHSPTGRRLAAVSCGDPV